MRNERPLYVGYQARAPQGTARFIGLRVAGVFAIGVLLALLITLAQKPFAVASFEFGQTRDFTGVVSEFPYPTLLVARPGASGTMPYSRYLLSAPGKFGVDALFSDHHAQTATLSGTLIFRDDQVMIEVQPDSVSFNAAHGELPATEALGQITLRGEIIDSKCYLGVMKPGDYKVHKACAIRCLSGGVPALFVVRRDDGSTEHVLLADEKGGALNEHILDLVAKPLEVTGHLHRLGSDLVLYASVDAFSPLRNDHL